MARVELPGSSVLAACSVLPWRGARGSWPDGERESFAARCQDCLARHAQEIAEAAGPADDIIWGGDFNQALHGHEWVGSRAGRETLRTTLAELGLAAVTANSSGAADGTFSIDHVAVPQGWAGRCAVETELPAVDGRALSDHPVYVVSVDGLPQGSDSRA
jgi:hypothetical protein